MAAVCFQEPSQNSARMQISWRFFVSRRRLKVNSRRLLVPGARCMHVLHAARRVSGSKPGTTPRPRTRPFGHHAALQIQCKRMHLCESAYLPTACCISMRAEICSSGGPPLTLRALCTRTQRAPERCCLLCKHEPQIYLLRKFRVLRVTPTSMRGAMHARHRNPLINHANFINSTF
jgi:hypothetical protein